MTRDERTAGLAAYLRQVADNIERLESIPVETPTATSLREAWTQLSPLANDLSLEVQLKRYGTGQPFLRIEIWDGKTIYQGCTIAEAVGRFMLEHGPKPEPKDPMDAIADVLDDEPALADSAA